MKKILTIIAVMACMLMPLAAFGMTPADDGELSTVTGQAGVSIAIDVTINLDFEKIAWGDNDGLGSGSGTTGGWVGLSSGVIENLRLHMRTDQGMADTAVAFAEYQSALIGGTTYTTQTDFNAAVAGGAGLTDKKVAAALAFSILATNQFLTIDVYTPSSGPTLVRLGLPTLELNMASLDASVGTWTDSVTGTTHKPGTYKEMGSLYIGGLLGYIGKDNYVDISANDTASGVLINVGNTSAIDPSTGMPVNNLIDYLHIDAVSWGDNDGLISGDPAGAGFVGLTDLTISALKLIASLNINVVTVTGNSLPALMAMDWTDPATMQTVRQQLAANDPIIKDDVLYLLHQAGKIGATVADIALNAAVRIGELSATCAIGPTKNLATNAGVLGSLYISNLSLTIPPLTYNTPGDPTSGVKYAASWIAIAAH